MSVLPNDRYEKTIAVAGQTVFNYDWDVPSAYPGQVKVIQFVLATQTKTTLTYGVDYTVDVANKRVTLTNAAAAGDTIVLYSGTPEARETDFTGSTVSVAAANEAIDNLTWQTQQLARDVKRCVRVDMVEGIMAGELPSVDARKNKYASWDNDGNLTYDDPVTGILNDYMRKDANLSDVNDVATSRTNLGLGDAATRNVGTTAGTVAAGNDGRFLTQAQKDALTNGGDANAMHTHSGYIATAEKGAPNGVATLEANSKIPNAQLPDTAVTSATNVSTNNEVALFNGVSGTQIKRSNKLLPNGDIVGTTDAQTLTNKTIDADNNTVSNLEVDNLKAGVLNTDLTGATSDTQVPSSKATKDYSDTKMGSLHNLGTGVQVGHDFTNGRLAMRTLIAKNGIQLVQNENDIYFYGVPSETTFPIFDKQGNGAQWYKQTIGNHVEYRSFTGSNGVTVAQNGDEIDSSLTNITAQGDMIVGDNTGTASTLAKGADDQVLRMDGDDPQWETPGTMIDQDSDNVNITGGAIDGVAISNGTVTDTTITGGTVSGLTAPIAIADGGTGQTTQTAAFDALSPLTTQGDILTHDGTNNVRLALGNAGEYLKVNAGGTDIEWGEGSVTPTTTQGDIIVRGATRDERLAIGTANHSLFVNSSGTTLEYGPVLGLNYNHATNIPSGADLNTYTTPGLYNVTSHAIGASLLNGPAQPTTSTAMLGWFIVSKISSTLVLQQYILYQEGLEYRRYISIGGSTGSWFQVLNNGMLASSKPTTTSTAGLDKPSLVIENYHNHAPGGEASDYWYYKYSDGFIMQGGLQSWSSATIARVTKTINLPCPYTSNICGAMGTLNTIGFDSTYNATMYLKDISITQIAFVLYGGGSSYPTTGFYWLSWGY